jgi:hypothetical protein
MVEPELGRPPSPLVSIPFFRAGILKALAFRSISGLTGEIPVRPLDGERLFPASASNDPGELPKLAFHAHDCPLRPLIAMHRVKRQDHAHVASYCKEVHLVA